MTRCDFLVAAILTLSPWPIGAQAPVSRLPETPRASMEIPPLTVTGRIVAIPANGNLQAALDAAQPGDTLVLEAGATYTGPFMLPNKAGAGWITLQSSRLEQGLPPAGVRAGPEHADAMPKLVTRHGSALIAADGAHHYRLVGLEIAPAPGVYLYNLVDIGTGHGPDQLASHFIFERSYLHGDATAGTRRGIAMNAAHMAVIDSYLADFKDPNADSQAICGWNGPGPFKIMNNYLEGAGENVMFGGGRPSIPNVVPSDIEIRGNHFSKPLAWKGNRWSVKNLAELKNGRRVLFDGNLFEHSWPHSQVGFAIVLTPRGEAPWAVVEDVTLTNNIVRHAEHGVNIMGRDGQSARTASRILIRNNLFDNINGLLFQILHAPADVAIEHNTGVSRKAVIFVEGAATPNLVLRNNLLAHGQYGIIGTGTRPGTPTISRYFSGATIDSNVFFGGQSGTQYPPGSTFVSLGQVGFVAPNAGDWRLRPDSPFRKRASGGRDLGVDLVELGAALGTSGQTPR
jgi:hypothetical protein